MHRNILFASDGPSRLLCLDEKMENRAAANSITPETAHLNGPLSVHPDVVSAPLELVHLTAGELIYDYGDPIDYAYFPLTTVVSLTLLLQSGATVEIASVGKEGLLGLPIVMGGTTMNSRAEVRTSGLAYRMKASDLKREFNEYPKTRTAILEYAQTMLTKVSQLSACNRHHSVTQQLTRWLLLALDREQAVELKVTHQAIAHRLGVRREGITEATGKLEQAGIILHSRGSITVLDRKRLEATCCECYGIVKAEFARLRQRTVELAKPDGGETLPLSSALRQQRSLFSSRDISATSVGRSAR